MGNECQIIIKKGPNAGRKCHEVNRWCKHYKQKCTKCNKIFMYRHTYDGHRCQRAKVHVAIMSKKINNNDDSNELHRIVSELKKEVKELKEQPRVHIDNLTVISDDIFSEMSNKMGIDNAVKFLMDVIKSDTECLDVVNRVYLDGNDRNKYPIACKDKDHFRFLGPDSDIIDDLGGKIIVSKLTESVQNAMIKANAELINQYNNNPSELMNYVNMLSLQEKLTRIPTADNQARFKRELAIKVRNPDHPFFQSKD